MNIPPYQASTAYQPLIQELLGPRFAIFAGCPPHFLFNIEQKTGKKRNAGIYLWITSRHNIGINTSGLP
jgi:hypothetical protein